MKLKIELLFQLLINYEELYRDNCISNWGPEYYMKHYCSYDESKYIVSTQIAENIIKDYVSNIGSKSFYEVYSLIDYSSLVYKQWGFHLGIPYFKFNERNKPLEESYCYWANYDMKYSGRNYMKYIEELNKLIENSPILYEKYKLEFEQQQQIKIEEAYKVESEYKKGNLEGYFSFILTNSFYLFEYSCEPNIEYNENDRMLVVDYYLPNIDEIPNIKQRTKSGELKYLSDNATKKLYDEIIYKIIIRSIAEIFHFDSLDMVTNICFNGRVKFRNPGTGQMQDILILSILVNKNEFDSIDLNYIDAKSCFKHLKGISGPKIFELSPVAPIIAFEKNDKRFISGHNIDIDELVNLAEMDWEDFEHLVREIFDMEFNANGGEVKITQASRDGGVDAVAFDPDPIRGGKIVIQAKRYNNIVSVSAIRDLYGTVINEGANKGILITTSDYGSESYAFAKGKPITLLNGGHLLYLLEKHGKKAKIEINRKNKR